MKFSDVIKTLCLCGCVFGSMCEDVGGMELALFEEKIEQGNKELPSLTSPCFYAPLCVTFPAFLNCCSSHLDQWPKVLAGIGPCVTFLCNTVHSDDLKYARAAIYGITSHYVYNNMLAFCSSEWFTDEAGRTLLQLLKIIPAVIDSLPILSEDEKAIRGCLFTYHPEQVVSDFSVFLSQLIHSNNVLSKRDIALFEKVHTIMAAHVVDNF